MKFTKSVSPISRPLDRRSFIKGVLAAGALTSLAPATLLAAERGAKPRRVAAGDRVKLACVGIGNRGAEVVKALHETGLAEVVALCDTDMGAKHTEAVSKLFPDVPRFQDFRKMFDKMGKDIEAVSVATPDFSHFPICMHAMSLGKHVYVEKPMAHSFKQIELLMAAEKKFKVACQMGNQGHSEGNYFQFKAWTEAGIIKNVTRITAYMNKDRRWHDSKKFAYSKLTDYLPEQPVPSTLDWDCWLATAKHHKYNVGYINGDWRSWFDFGNGALGDWGAHIIDTAHEFLDLGLPTAVEPKLEGHNSFVFPQATTLLFKFPSRGNMPAVDLTWYDGQENLPPLPNDLGESIVDANIPPPSKGGAASEGKKRPPGKVIYGEGLTFKGGSHGTTLQIVGEAKAKDMASKLPAVPSSPSNHFANFLKAAKGEELTRSNFAVAGPLCQAMAIGIIAQQVNAKLQFDRATKQITNHKVANELLNGVPPRKEWEQYYKL